MGGDLVLDRSTPGEGSAFTLWLPSTPARAADGAEPAAWGSQTRRDVADGRVQGLAEVGTYLRERVEEVLEAYVARLRADPAMPGVRGRDRADLEDHTMTLLGNLAQSLIIIAHSGRLDSELLKDGGEIQRLIAELHGRQRQHLGWTEAMLAREYELLAAEVEALVHRGERSHADGAPHIDVGTALAVIRRLLARAAETSARAFRHSARGVERGAAGAVADVDAAEARE